MLCTYYALTDNGIFFVYHDNCIVYFMIETFSFDYSDCVILRDQKDVIIHSSFTIKMFGRVAGCPKFHGCSMKLRLPAVKPNF